MRSLGWRPHEWDQSAPALRPLVDTGDGTMCELGRALTRHRVCGALILDVCPPDSEDAAHGSGVTGA